MTLLEQAFALQQGGKLNEALAVFKQVLVSTPDDPALLTHIATLLLYLGDYAESMRFNQHSLQIAPQQAVAHCHLGLGLQYFKRFDEALVSYCAALILNPDYVEAYYNQGLVFQELGRLTEAVGSYDCAINLRPDYADAWYRRGNCLLTQQQYADAIVSFNMAITFKADYHVAYCRRAKALSQLNRLDEAFIDYDQALLINPDSLEAYCNRGLLWNQLNQFETAISDFEQAIALNPQSQEAHFNRGVALCELQRFDEALLSYQRSIDCKPEFAGTYWNMALLLLLLGRYESGWQYYERRWEVSTFNSPALVTSRPRWLPGMQSQRLLVWSEQGVGDQLFFAGLLPEARQMAEQLLVTVDARLIPLLERSMPDISFLPKDQLVPEDQYDAQLPIGDLAAYFRPSAASFSATQSAYCVADSQQVELLRQQLLGKTEFLIGISWRSKNAQNGEQRSLDLAELAGCLCQPGVRLVNLQYGEVTAELVELERQTGISVWQCPTVDTMLDLDGLAALISGCDLVVSADNSTVHLAAALGKPTWVLLPFLPDWRWLLTRCDSPWYPSVRLFRQLQKGSWSPVLKAIEDSVNALVRRSLKQ